MSSRRWWLSGAVLVIVVTILLGWMAGVSPLLAAAKAADEAREGVDAQNQLYGQQLASLKTQFEGIDALTAELDELRKQLPAAAHLPSYLAQLVDDAQQSAVTIGNIAVSDAVPYAPVVVEGAVPTAETPATATAEAETQVAPTGGVPLSDPLVTAENFVAIPVSISVDGDYANVLNFLESLQMGTRLTAVTSFTTVPLSEAPAGSSGDGAPTTSASTAAVTGTMSLFIYVLLDPTAAG